MSRANSIALLFIASLVLTDAASAAIPDVSLEVAVRTKEGEKIDDGVHILELRCGGGNCSLTSISLNQCIEQPSGKKGFFPKVQRSTTLDGEITVRREGNALIVTESGNDMGGSYVNTKVHLSASRKGRRIGNLFDWIQRRNGQEFSDTQEGAFGRICSSCGCGDKES